MSGSIALETLTPCFCRGAYQSQPEFRVNSIRGQLRWWHRALGHSKPDEWQLYGGIKAKSLGFSRDDDALASCVRLWIPGQEITRANSLILPHHNHRANALKPGSEFRLAWEFRKETPKKLQHAFEHTLKAWSLLGGLGFRSNRAAGSIWPLGKSPTSEQFNAAVTALSLPATLTVHLLDCNGVTDHEGLRRIACDTRTAQRGTNEGKVLGWIQGSNRLASALKLKVVRLSDRPRLLAVCDRRADRGDSHFRTAIDYLNGRRLGTEMSRAGIK